MPATTLSMQPFAPVREWEVDGLKLDFVDEFATGADTVPFDPTRMDVGTVEEGADLLLFTIRERLTAIRPDVLIEFRQQYVGPDMRAYGNVFRANDCPASALANRVRTIDLRLLSGSTAIHSDMLMWHREDSVESAALQFVSVLFSAPQLSVRLDAQSEGQIAMIRWWLDVFSRYRSVLHRGALRVYGAAANYTRVETVSDAVRVVVLYGEGFVEIGPRRRRTARGGGCKRIWGTERWPSARARGGGTVRSTMRPGRSSTG
jgi:alpha-galactosidase